MSDRLTIVRRHIAAESARRFAWGRADCACFVADYIRAAAGLDLMGGLRGAWRSGYTACEFLAARGGFVAAVRDALDAGGLVRIDPQEAAPGDVGIVICRRPACAIRTEHRWALRAPAGVQTGFYPALMVWRLPTMEQA